MRPLAACLLLSLPLAAQTGSPPPPPPSDPALVARLEAPIPIVMAGPGVELTLTLTARRDTAVPLRALAGLDLVTRIGSEPGPTFRIEAPVQEGGATNVPLAAGTKIERRLTIDLGDLAGRTAAADVPLTDVVFEWPGLPGASTSVRVAPDLRQVDLDSLDLARTKVVLVTSHGNIVVAFRPDKAPNTVRNFVKLAKEGFYNGTKFHRVLPGFMIQGGCPYTKAGATGRPGTGGPGYTVPAEFNDIPHVRGVLSMARSQDPNSAGSQFFVMHGDEPMLNGQYTAFGTVETGLDTVDKIVSVPLTYGGEQRPSRPTVDVHLHAAIVLPVQK
jgi:peptidyl-prolyl cis-trans isomerase B (cyclophilin B)